MLVLRRLEPWPMTPQRVTGTSACRRSARREGSVGERVRAIDAEGFRWGHPEVGRSDERCRRPPRVSQAWVHLKPCAVLAE